MCNQECNQGRECDCVKDDLVKRLRNHDPADPPLAISFEAADEIEFLRGQRAKGNMVLVPADKLKEMQEELASLRQQQSEPVAWVCINEDGGCEQIDYCKESPLPEDEGFKPLYLAPPAQSESERDAARYRWLRDEHNVDLPLARVVVKKGGVRKSSEWCDLIDGFNLNAFVDAAMQEGKK